MNRGYSLIDLSIYILITVMMCIYSYDIILNYSTDKKAKHEAYRIYYILKKEIFLKNASIIILEGNSLCLTNCYELDKKFKYNELQRSINSKILNRSFTINISNRYKVIVNNINNLEYINMRVEKYEK